MKERYKQDFLTAGVLAKEVRAFGKSLIKEGASYNQIISQINQKIVDLGGRAAFPPQIALNYVAAHFLPNLDEDIILSDQVVKLDIGVCYNGAIGDCAVTVDLSNKNQGLVDAAEAALLAAEQSIKVGLKIREIGKIIEDKICSYGLQPVRNLSGHGLGYYKIHTPPSIPNYDDKAEKGVIKPGMTFAIEPFATNGKGFIYDAGNPTIFSFVKERHPSAYSPLSQYLLKKIRTFGGLPFAIHDMLGSEYSASDIQSGIADLISLGVIVGYAPLVEEAQGFVAQAENSILVDLDGNVFVTTR